jgi:diguanylate cyclase (GGDEF)-like protein/PAS domain S-box-containing protein
LREGLEVLTQAHRALAAIDVVVKTGTADVDSSPLYRALIENPAYGICRMDSHGNFLDANETLVVMLGYLSKDALLKPSTNVVWDPSTRAQVLEACRQTGYVQRIEVEWACQNGAAIQVRLGGRQVWAEPGVPNGYELIVEDVTEQRALEAHLRYLVATDALTGLANYRRLAEALGGEIERSTRTGRPFAILMFDLNGMKRINDRYGHLAGNRALCRLADALRASCRSIDTLARCGGDEFVVVLPETRASEAGVLARRICHRLADDPEQPPLATSVGLAVYPHDGDTIDHLFCTADHALYRMKNGAI